VYKDKTIGVVVPAYNEEKLIGRVIETMLRMWTRSLSWMIAAKTTHPGGADLCRCTAGHVVFIRHGENGGWEVQYAPATNGAGSQVGRGSGHGRRCPDGSKRPAALLDPVISGEVDYSKATA